MSDFSSASPYVAGAVVAAVVYLVLRASGSRKGLPLPPGPRRLPIIGNLLNIPVYKEWLTYRSWTEKYGDLVYIEALGTKLLILGSEETVRDLAEKRVHWQSRGRLPMLSDLVGFDWGLSVLPYGQEWKESRRLLHAHVHSSAATTYQPVQLASARALVVDLLRAKLNMNILPTMVRTNFGKTTIKMVYGIDVKNGEDEYISMPEKVLHVLSEAAIPGRFFVDLFPILKDIPLWFPGASFRRYAADLKALQRVMRDRPVEVTQTQLATGIAPTSIVQRMLDEMKSPGHENMELIKDVAGIVYLAGLDTTVSAVMSFFLAMVIYPDVQLRAQAELDSVVGRNRLPEFSDKKDLPYVNAVMSECLRWLPVLPMGVPHLVMQDDEYKGYFIPKGTLALPAQWALLHDPEMYPNPEQFMPERYLDRLPSGAWSTRGDVRDPRNFCFGFGRRICPGVHIAEQSLFAMVATVLHTLSIGRSKDMNGNEMVPQPDAGSGLLSHPKPFDYTIRMRDDAKDLVQMCDIS